LWCAAVDRVFAELNDALTTRAAGLRGVDELTTAKLLIREFVYFCAAHPQLHGIITQESKTDGPRMDWLVERHVRPVYEQTTTMIEGLIRAGHIADFPAPHYYYIITGAAPTMFVLGPECRRLSGLDPQSPEVIEAHADAVISLLFGTDERDSG
jgi:TetR/AcrR family transcriptional regulator